VAYASQGTERLDNVPHHVAVTRKPPQLCASAHDAKSSCGFTRTDTRWTTRKREIGIAVIPMSLASRLLELDAPVRTLIWTSAWYQSYDMEPIRGVWNGFHVLASALPCDQEDGPCCTAPAVSCCPACGIGLSGKAYNSIRCKAAPTQYVRHSAAIVPLPAQDVQRYWQLPLRGGQTKFNKQFEIEIAGDSALRFD
jgi:hypothetical protein